MEDVEKSLDNMKTSSEIKQYAMHKLPRKRTYDKLMEILTAMEECENYAKINLKEGAAKVVKK